MFGSVFVRIRCFLVLAMLVPSVGIAGVITGYLQYASGSQSATEWGLAVTNTGIESAINAQIDSFNLAQLAGPACTPVVLTGIPYSLGTIGPSATVVAPVTINFTGCLLLNTEFRLETSFSADGGLSGSLILPDLPADPSLISAPVYPAAESPEPATLWTLALPCALIFLRAKHHRR